MSAEIGNISGLVARLRKEISGQIYDSEMKLSEYSTDASNYRVRPSLVVTPLNGQELITAVEISHEFKVPVTMRGGGTSIAGNSIGTGIIIDTSVHMNKILEIDKTSQSARVQPGVILSNLQSAAAPLGLHFGPDPSTQNRATMGGLIGNNSCGPHALAYGKTADNVISLDGIDGRLRRFKAGRGLDAIPGLSNIVNKNLAVLRTEFGQFGRQVSGYSFEHLLPENGNNLAAALTGTEGTLLLFLKQKLNWFQNHQRLP